MAQTALKLPVSEISTLRLIKNQASKTLTRTVPKSELIFLAITLISLQVLDGLLTAIGVSHFGSDIEGNPLLRGLIESWGALPVLALVKTAAIGIVITLCGMVNKVQWLGTALKCIIVLYLIAAIIPWAMVLTFNVA